MDKIFNSSPFSQATYSPLRNSQDQGQDEDDPEPNINNTHNNRISFANSPSYLNSFSPSKNQNYKQFRHRSYSQSSNRSVHSMSDQQHSSPQPLSFAEGEIDTEGSSRPFSIRISNTPIHHSHSNSNSNNAAGSATGVPISPTSRRSSANNRIYPSNIISTTSDSLASMNDKFSSPPPKYSAEDLEFSEPSPHSYGRDEEGGLSFRNNEDNKGDRLLMQASTTLVIAVSGLICAGWLLDVIQHWPVFIDISELIILIPILLNLKGNLEMNLASRLSTAANMGLLDQKESRNAFIIGNLALLQVQGLSVGSIAGLFSFVLGVIVHPTTNNFSEISLMITASMLCAAMSSLVLGGFMCGLVLICRKYNINPDNIACPLASSFGDLVTLIILAGCSIALKHFLHTAVPVIVLVILLASIPAWVYFVRKNKFVSEVVKEGWVPVLIAMVISSTAGLTLERYINEFPGMALISPVLNGLAGNIASIYASRISTALHVNIKENYRATERTLFFVHIPIQGLFLLVIALLDLGHVRWSVVSVLGYMIVSLSLIMVSLILARWITHMFWKWGYDPDNYALPILSSVIDVIGTGLLVLGFMALHFESMD